MRRCGRRRWLSTIAALALAGGTARGDGVHVHLRGAARVEARGARAEGDEMIVRGAVTDDAGNAMTRAPVAITVARAATPQSALPFDSGARAPRSCDTGASGPEPRVEGGTLRATTDETGRFCVRVPIAIDRYVVRVAYGGSPLVDAATVDAQVDLGRRACMLGFPAWPGDGPRAISLDANAVGVEATASIESDGATRPGSGLALTLTTERAGPPLAAATTDASGHAHFTLDPTRLGPPGLGELRVAFAGSADVASAARSVTIERHARVELDVPGAVDRKLTAGAPEDGVAIEVSARAAGGEVTSGSVEARVDGAVVGAAPIGQTEPGRARLVATFSPEWAGSNGDARITLRYVPSAPWLEPGMETAWLLPIRGRSLLRDAPLVLAGLAVLAWFVAGRVQRARARKVPVAPAKRESRGEAKLDLVRAARNASEGWSGRVLDADDGTPVIAARVSIERPAFGRAEVLATVVVDEGGRFELLRVALRPSDELAIEAPLHVTLRRPLPSPGELDAQLVLRRRALLARLVHWAKQRGKPFDSRPEPTPGHVKRAAGEDYQIASWAAAIERAAYAGDEVDAHLELEIDKLAPSSPVKPKPQEPPPPPPDPGALLNPTKPNR